MESASDIAARVRQFFAFSRVSKLFAFSRPAEAHFTWEKLKSGDHYFSTLAEIVRAVHESRKDQRADHILTFPRWPEDANRLMQWVSEKLPGEIDFWPEIRGLWWCAQQAAERNGPLTEIDRAAWTTLGNLPPYLAGREAWAWGTMRTFLDTPIRPRRSAGTPALNLPNIVHMPIVAVKSERQADGSDKKNALFFALQIEILESGTGDIFLHPRDALVTQPDDEFYAGLRAAWRAARNEAAKGAVPSGRESDDTNTHTEPAGTRAEALLLCDCRFRILQNWAATPDGRSKLIKPAGALGGRSASAAAFVAMYRAITGAVADDRLLVIAQVTDRGTLDRVTQEGLLAKVAEACKQEWVGLFDTVVVVPDNEPGLIFNPLSGFKNLDVQSAVMAAGLLTVHSLAFKAAQKYLETTIQRHEKIEDLPDMISAKLSDLFVPIRIHPNSTVC